MEYLSLDQVLCVDVLLIWVSLNWLAVCKQNRVYEVHILACFMARARKKMRE